MIGAGSLTELITIQRSTVSIADDGSKSTVWSDLLNAWAQKRDHTADEIATGFGAASQLGIVFVMRWHPTEFGTADRVIFKGQPYAIKQIADLEGGDGYKISVTATR